jgi:predicted Zn finger-like uncharacterized protein
MLIVCPSCATAYNVEAESLRPDGRQVRCVRCRAVWQAGLSHADKLLAAAEAIGSAPGEPGEAPEPQFAAEPEAAGVGDGAADLPPSDEQRLDEQADAAPIDEDDAASAPLEDDAAADPPAEVADIEAPPIAPVDLDQGRLPIDIEADRAAAQGAGAHEDVESVAARRRPRRARARPRTPRWPLSRLQTVILALLFVDVLLVGWRSDFVRALPQTASFYATMGLPVNLRGLAFTAVATAAEQHEGVPILVVEGNVVNDARKTVEVPRLKFIIRNAARQEIYSWTAVPSRAALAPGEAVAFRTRLASPPAEARDVLVRFVTRRDIVGAIR